MKSEIKTIYGGYFTDYGKTFFVDLVESEYGKYIKISITKEQERKTIMIPENLFHDFFGHVSEIEKAAGMKHE